MARFGQCEEFQQALAAAQQRVRNNPDDQIAKLDVAQSTQDYTQCRQSNAPTAYNPQVFSVNPNIDLFSYSSRGASFDPGQVALINQGSGLAYVLLAIFGGLAILGGLGYVLVNQTSRRK